MDIRYKVILSPSGMYPPLGSILTWNQEKRRYIFRDWVFLQKTMEKRIDIFKPFRSHKTR